MKNKTRFVKMVESTNIPLNFQFIEKKYHENTTICYEAYMNDFAGRGRIRSFYKANSNINNINPNENR